MDRDRPVAQLNGELEHRHVARRQLVHRRHRRLDDSSIRHVRLLVHFRQWSRSSFSLFVVIAMCEHCSSRSHSRCSRS
jgi:hypothetical protein